MTPDQLDDIHRAVKRGEVFAYFGYGSLVNRDTHRTQIHGAARASVRGWRRYWQGRPSFTDIPVSLLSVKVESDPEHDLPGLLVFDRIESLAALDEREFNYDRRNVAAEAISVAIDLPSDLPVYIYEGKPDVALDTDHAILQSYLDAVLQGYLLEYGTESVLRFIRETHAFDDRAVIRDRHAPRYSRAVKLSKDEVEMFDDALAAHGVRFRETP